MLCKRGCAAPAVPKHLLPLKKSHLQMHFGIVAGQQPNYNLENVDWTMCLLHAGLCIVGGLLKRTLLGELDILVDPAATEGQGMQLYNLFLKNGLYMKLTMLAKKSKKLDKHDLAFKSSSFTGRAGEIVMRIKNQVCACLLHTHEHIYLKA